MLLLTQPDNQMLYRKCKDNDNDHNQLPKTNNVHLTLIFFCQLITTD